MFCMEFIVTDLWFVSLTNAYIYAHLYMIPFYSFVCWYLEYYSFSRVSLCQSNLSFSNKKKKTSALKRDDD